MRGAHGFSRASVPSLGCVRPAISVYPRSMSRPDTAQARCAYGETQTGLFREPGLVAHPVKYKHLPKSLGNCFCTSESAADQLHSLVGESGRLDEGCGPGPHTAGVHRNRTGPAPLIQQTRVVVLAFFQSVNIETDWASSLAWRPMARTSVPSLGCVRPAISVYPRSMSRPDTAQARCAYGETQACLFSEPGLAAQPVQYKHSQKAGQQSSPNQPLLSHLVCRAFPLTDHMHHRPIDQQLGRPSPGVVVAGHAHAVRAC